VIINQGVVLDDTVNDVNGPESSSNEVEHGVVVERLEVGFEGRGLSVDDGVQLQNEVLNVSHKLFYQVVYFSVHSQHFSSHDFGGLPLSSRFFGGLFAVHEEIIVEVELEEFSDFLDFVVDEGEDDEDFFIHEGRLFLVHVDDVEDAEVFFVVLKSVESYDLSEADQGMVYVPDSISKALFFDIIDFLREFFESVDVVEEVFLVKVV
jgi:hypothetical protein